MTTSLGSVTVQKVGGSEAQAEVLRSCRSETGEASLTVCDAIQKTDIKGFLMCESGHRATEVVSLTNYTNEEGPDKWIMTPVLQACIVAEHRMSKSSEIRVKAADFHWNYMHLGFEPISKPDLRNRWRFPAAPVTLYFITKWIPLSADDKAEYEAHKAQLADALCVKEPELRPLEVCKCYDLAKEMNLIFRLAMAHQKPLPAMAFPLVEMRMNPASIKKGEQLILASTLRFDPKLVDTLQKELLEEYAAKKTMPDRVANLIYDFSREE